MPEDVDGTEGAEGEVFEDELDSDLEVGSTEGDDEGDAEGADDESSDEELYVIKVKGAEKSVTRDELVRLAQQGEDYTQKTQALAAERELAASYKELEKAFAKDPQGTLASLAEAYGITPQADIEAMDPLEKELHELKTWRRNVEAESRQQAVKAELASVKQTYDHADLDEGELLAYAVEHRSPNLDDAYRSMFWDRRPGKTSPKVESKQAKVAAKRSAPAVSGGAKRAGGVNTPGASDHMSIREAYLAAVAEFGE